ncbi:MAG TPA: hypothetical protein DCY48_02120 [Candidatus Magasanikbacteria bacterium]|nr:MAG: hypothetical protein A3I74_01030 [Candidatus Magasanikbacteria bacterium RIFCSPLOWO2_02_FULL_47_16]OGH79972.1 MAG: hypothetical protein A3C10_02195 [Candidatus Magasanikbacteria bacterium RIFCSPHIGHO2_02_FULL_48_18]OGH82984.1 MAG: hypothetical protein A3G08_03680 [Candidatus Magasanikbacteria bacterium RIFCSPLOWO2_12_FULL_47_9b]HAZ28552.1 hypothetical protein [Candidatus Magasanikbacteria bacterium]
MDEKGARELVVPRDITINLRNVAISLSISVGRGEKTDLSILVNDTTSKEQIAENAGKAIHDQYWYADEVWEQEDLKERFCIDLEEHKIDVFVFGDDIKTEQRDLIVQSIERVYNLLGGQDREAWDLESIQILARENKNLKNNQLMRGGEYPVQKRFELFTPGIALAPYREGELPCSELEGTLIHELTHMVLENRLAQLWEGTDLGWRSVEPDELIELPGGAHTSFYNERPQECPTSYACLQGDDDRAESVIAYIFSPDTLDPKRKKILDQVFTQSSPNTKAVLTHMPVTLPELPSQMSVSVAEAKSVFAPSKKTAGAQEPKPKSKKIISLGEYRQQKCIAEPIFLKPYA